MLKIKSVAILSCLLTVSGCTSVYTSKEQVSYGKEQLPESHVANWSLMIGKWYAIQPAKQGGTREVLSERFSDGTYQYTFRLTDNSGVVKTTTEIGVWGISGNVYFSIYRGMLTATGVSYSDPSDPYNYDAYIVLELNKEMFKYRSAVDGEVYVAKRVSDDFNLPKM